MPRPEKPEAASGLTISHLGESLGLRARVALIAGGLFLLVGALATVLYVKLTSDFERGSLANRADHRARVEAESLSYPLWTLDFEALERAMSALANDPDHQSVRVLNPSGGLIIGRGTPTRESVIASRPITLRDGQNVRPLGSIEIALSTARIDAMIGDRYLTGLLIGLAMALGLAATIYAAMGRWVITPIEAMAQAVGKLAEGAASTDALLKTARLSEFMGLRGALTALLDSRRRIERLAAIESEAAGVRAAQGRLVDAIESLAEGMVLWDRDGKLVVCNQPFRDFCGSFGLGIRPGIDYDEVMGAAVAAGIFSSESAEQGSVAPSWRSHAQAEERRFQVTSTDGAILSISDRPMADGGRVAIYRDVTETMIAAADLRAQTEAAETARREATAASRAKSEFLANMSHELRTPLNAIIGFSEIMESELFGAIGQPRYLTYIADIHRAGKHLLGLVNDLLDLSRIDAGKLVLHREALDVAALATSVVSLVRPQADQQGVSIEQELSVDSVWADRRALLQILLNLMSNAIKFTPPQGVVTLTLSRLDGGAGGIYVAVRDTGVGMTASEVMMAREKFGQVNSTLVSKRQGTGLGLPIAEGLVNAHGARLEIDSQKGVGTTVWFRLPLKAAAPVAEETAANLPNGS
ncbi:MAG: ATP-binding protein, partial [Elsteraceae bacterium]